MLRVIGWLVVTGFATYGLERFVSNHVVLDKSKLSDRPASSEDTEKTVEILETKHA